mmetsp:Transcript_49971/g.99518  ORF Transcript_49971/g.99518 Transcript_49971/m.99518 type:complete len:81 (-) Transcript_49971:165-407(-)
MRSSQILAPTSHRGWPSRSSPLGSTAVQAPQQHGPPSTQSAHASGGSPEIGACGYGASMEIRACLYVYLVGVVIDWRVPH